MWSTNVCRPTGKCWILLRGGSLAAQGTLVLIMSFASDVPFLQIEVETRIFTFSEGNRMVFVYVKEGGWVIIVN